jgi:hypothetical protein
LTLTLFLSYLQPQVSGAAFFAVFHCPLPLCLRFAPSACALLLHKV